MRNLLQKPTLTRPSVYSILLLLTLLAALVPPPDSGDSVRTGATSDVVIIHATGKGNPYINNEDGRFQPTKLLGETSLVRAVATGRAKPTALATGDFDSDGIPDLIAGYSLGTGGIVGVRKGILESIYPIYPPEHGMDVNPFSESVQLFRTRLAPTFLETGDFNLDGRLDVVAVAENGASLELLAGGGDGTLDGGRLIDLPGRVTAVASGEVNRQDGMKDLLVAVTDGRDGSGENALLVFDDPAGALNGSPEFIALPGAGSAILIDQLDNQYPFDIAVASGRDLVIVHGRDKTRYDGSAAPTSASHASTAGHASQSGPEQTIHRLPFSATRMASGDFTGGYEDDIALLSEAGDLWLFEPAAAELTRTPYSFSAAGTPLLATAAVSSRFGDDLMVLDRDQSQIHALTRSHFEQKTFLGPEAQRLEFTVDPVSVSIANVPISLAPMRLNKDGLADWVVLTEDAEGAIAVSMSAPMASFTVNAEGDDWDVARGDGVCVTINGNCTLTAAIQETNALPGPDEINFSINLITGRYGEQIRETATVDGSSQGHVELTVSNSSLTFSDESGSSVVRGMAIHGSISVVEDGGVIIEGNYMGTDATGSTNASNNGNIGLAIGADGNVVGGATAAARNVMDGKLNVSTSENVIIGNYVGVAANGTDELGPSSNPSISVRDQSGGTGSNNVIGQPGAGNVVSSSSGIGVRGNARGNLVMSNYVGTDASGQNRLGNFQSGISVTASSNTIGGSAAGQGNLTSGNPRAGIEIDADSIVVQGNLAGLTASGIDTLGNGRWGILVRGSSYVVIGGSLSGEGNTISGNGEVGLRLGSGVSAVVQGNNIGTDVFGTLALGNVENGIEIWSGVPEGIVIGGSTFNQGNIVAANGEAGIFLSASLKSAQILGNFIGTNRGGGVDIGNAEHGVLLAGSGHVLYGNTIAYNGLSGVFVTGSSGSEGNTVRRNSIFENGKLGINLNNFRDDDFGVTENDDGDPDTGPNLLQNYPELVFTSSGDVTVSLNSIASSNFVLDFYGGPVCDESEHGEGKTHLDSLVVATDASGNHTVDIGFDVPSIRRFITSTATDADGNTSEFSNCVEVGFVKVPFVKVMQDSTGQNFKPVANEQFIIAKIDFSDPLAPLDTVGTQVSDKNGIIILDPDKFSPGDQFYLVARAHEEGAVKDGHEKVDDLMYSIWVDNVFIDNDGGLHPAELEASIDDTTVTYLGHSTIRYHVVVSIEFPAHDDYALSVVAALIDLSDLLFDITNGHAYVAKAAISDDKRNWKNADIRIHASNTEWPRASLKGIDNGTGSHLYMPPKYYGSKEDNVNKIFAEDPPDMSTRRSFETLAHELGHYAFGLWDEYSGRLAGAAEDSEFENVHDDISFGFMDGLHPAHPRNTEMSANESMTAGEAEKFKDTEQFIKYGMTAWDFYRNQFKGEFGNIRVEIHTPGLRGLTNDVVAGPNSDVDNPDWSMGASMEFEIEFSHANEPRQAYLFKRMDTGEILAGMGVESERETPGDIVWMAQGKTVHSGPDRGKIRPFGLKPGDKLVASDFLLEDFVFIEVEVPASAGKTMDDIVLELSPVSGDFTLLPSANISIEGDLVYSATANADFDGAPRVTLSADGDDDETIVLGGEATGYAGEFQGAPDEGRLIFRAVDDAGATFPVVHRLSVFDLATAGPQLIPAGADLEIEIDPDKTEAGQLTTLTSPFPVPTKGLPDSLLRVSPLYSLSTVPVDAALVGSVKIYYDGGTVLASVPDAVTIYRWDDGWMPLTTAVNKSPSNQTATASIDHGGFYVAYLDLTRATATAVDEDELPDQGRGPEPLNNYPNPFSEITRIPLTLGESSTVSLTVFNVLGQEVGQIGPTVLQPGTHELLFDASGMPQGVYIYVVELGDERIDGVMMVAR